MIDCLAHTVERIIGPWNWHNLKKNQTHEALIEEGFSPEEAQSLGWLFDHRNYGRNYGFVIGAVTVYCCDRWIKKYTYNMPYLRLHNSSVWITRGLVLFAFLQAADYVSTARRKGGDMGVAHDLMWVNTRYTESKERFIRNFEVMNRKFTPLEKEILHNRQLINESPIKERKWIYNPYLHGDDEQAFWNNVQKNLVDKLAPWERKDVQIQIAEENKDKVEQGEKIRLKPYQITNDVDSTGVKFGFRRNPFINRWTPIQ